MKVNLTTRLHGRRLNNGGRVDMQFNRIMEESDGPVLCLEVTKPVTVDGYTKMYWPELESRFNQYGYAKILFHYTDPASFPGWESGAAELDMNRFAEYGRNIKKVALIDAPAKVVQRWELMRQMLGGEIRIFKTDEFDIALDWIKS